MASAIPKGTVPKRTIPRLLSRARLKTLTLLPASLIKDTFFSSKKNTTCQRSFLPNIRPRIELPPTPVSCLFQISPSEIVFRNYTADDVIETELFLINKDTFNRLVKVSMERSPYFELLCPNDAYHIVPPGTSCPVRIRFTPKNNEFYFHELICITGLERIVVPIRGVATRMRDFTEELNFSKCPVNHCTLKTLEIYNDTDQKARYHVNVEGPFSVDPETAILDPGETLEMTVAFHAEYTGDHFGMLAVCRNQGEKIVRTKLRGEAVNIKAVLSTNTVKFGKTFVNTSSEKIIFIENRSNVATFFQWKSFPSVEAEEDEKTRLRSLLRPKDGKWLHDFIKNKNIENKEYCEKTIDVWRRKREEEIEKVQNDPLFFSNEFFSIEPKEGTIEPHCQAEIKVTFKPQETQDYEYKAYCIIAGRDTRVALKLTGQGEGPMVELSNPTLSLGDVLVNTTHTYEVKLINQGGVDAPFTYIPSTKDLGDCFKFAPEEGIIAPGRIQTIQISFKITTLGNFEQEFQFSVAGSKTPAILTITGCVCPATVEFDREELDFGDISFGFPYTAVCRLINTSPGSLTFKVRMSQDGRQPAVSAYDQILKPNDSAWRDGIHFYLEPKEFSLNPNQGIILPQGYRDIQVTLCSNTVMSFYRRLLVDLEGFGTEMAKLVITARCIVPDLRVRPQIQDYSQCLLKVPYTRKFFIVNCSELPACYGLIPQDRNEDTPVLYSSPKSCGIIEPRSFEEIPVVIEVQAWGNHSTEGFIGVFGDERYPRSIILRSSGRLADIYTVPREIDFGRIQALEPNSQSLTLFNEGLAPVDFRMEVVRKPHCYVIEPREGVIPARGEVPVTITATLDDIGAFADTIQLFIWNTPWMTCLVRALGAGTAIVIDKPFGPELNFGYQFSFLPCTHQFKVTNRSPHSHRLSWSVEHDNHSISALSSSTTEDLSQSSKHTFWLEPRLIELQPGESVDVVLQGVSRVAQEVQQRVICEAVVKDRRKEKIAETTIICKFIDPSLEISTREISFWVEKKPSDVLALQYKPLALKNTCCLPLDLMLDLEKPFLVCGVDLQPLPDGKPVTVDVGQTCHFYVAFDPAYKTGFHSWKDKKVLKINMGKDHHHVEHITLLGEVYFPNLEIQSSTLDFGCIVAGTEEVRCLQMTNCSPLPVQYHWSFQLDSHVNQFKHELYPPKFLPQPPRMKRTCLPLSSQWRRFKMTNREETASLLKETVDLAQSLAAEVPPGAAESHSPLELKKFRLSTDVPYPPLKVDKAFSILPQLGELQPGKSQRVMFTFSGHLDTIASATALCHVEGGPTYKVELTGEASRISYSLSHREIDCGCQMFNEIHHCRVTLANTGKIEFNWALNLSTAEQHLPGMFLVNPTHGSIARGEQQVLKFSYMPGIPGAFSRTFQLKVAELYLDNICLKGEASFPMICVNLPWTIKGNEKYKKPLKQHVKPLHQCNQRNKSVAQKKTRSSKTLKSRTPKTQTVKTQTPKTRALKTQNLNPQVLGSGISSSIKLQVETVMNLIKKPALELQKKFPSHHSNSRFPDKELCQNLVKVELPEYVLDMGTVLKGNTETRTVMIINPGQIPVSFQAKVSALENTGFRVNPDHMKGLLHNQTRILEVCFDSACWAEGGVDVLLPIKVAKGPTYNIRLCATVLELSLDLSKDTLQFSDILVGQCQIETVRLYNKFQVPCKWFIMSVKPDKKHKQRKYWTPAVGQKQQEDKSCPFQVTPSKGTLDPGSWQNLQIQFTPKEQRFYKNELKLNICDSRHCLKLHLSGKGLEAQLEFSPPALKMDWVLVDSDGLDTTVVVKNPCNFPVEFYSLDFDEQYLEEEKILRMAVGSEYQKNFLMPPRAIGGTLPSEVLEHYEAQKRLKAQQAKLRAMADAMATAEAQAVDKAAPAYHGAVTPSPEPMVEVTGNPISRAVMRHMGIDPSSDRCEAQQDRGIVFIVHGPPRTGKTEVAAALCHYYDAAHLSIDTVVKETIASHQNEAGCRAQELCTNAAMELKSEDEGNAGIKSQITAQSRNKLASVDKNNKKNAKGKSPSAQKRKETASKLDKKFTVATAPAPQQLNIISSHGEELNCLSCVLPEDLLVDILCERLKREDCYKGVVFDGLESLFASSLDSSLLCVFKAVKNRRHIYVVNLHQDYGSWITKQESERNMREAKREMEELQQKKAFQRNMERILKMDEDEYDALSEERRALVDKIILGRKALRRERERKQLARKLEEEARALEEEERQKEEERRKEEERLKKQKKRASLGKQPAKQEKKESKSPEKKETKSPEKKTKPPDKMDTKAPEKKETKIPEKKEIKSPGRKETKIPPEKGEPIAPEEKETKNLEDEIIKMLEDSINKFLEDEITEILEEETGSPEKEETKSPEKGETKASEKRKTKASKKPKAPGKGKRKAPKRRKPKAPGKGESKAPGKGEPEAPEWGVPEAPGKWEPEAPEKEEPKAPKKGESKTPKNGDTRAPGKREAEIPEYPDEMDNLIQRFQIYESSQQDIAQVLTYFDRIQGTMQLPVIQNGNISQPSAESKGQKTNKPPEKVEKKPEQKSGGQRSLQSSRLETQSEVAEGSVRDEHVEVPCLDIHITNPEPMIKEILSDKRLPTKEEMLRYLGLHPEGPPLPPAAVFSIVNYPEERLVSAECVKLFTIAAPEGAAMEDNLPHGRRLKRYRWIVPSHGEVELKVHFSTGKPGKFEQALRFELVESKRLYELPCSCTGLFPSICQNPRRVFPKCRETKKADEIIFKEYVKSTKQFHFGPLLCGKSREWYKAQNYPGNSENITILNNSPVVVEVHFYFENDGKAETFLLDPPSMTLKPEEKQELTIWAYPTSPGFLEDRLICCIEKNPEPVVFGLCCHGVHVKLEVSPLELSFDKLLLHRTDSRTLVLKNDTLLPMAWQFSGLDDLVETFSLSQDNGIIDPRSEFKVTLNFKAEKIGIIEKILRLEVSDTENILGIVQAENIEISAEVYDVSLSIDMPEGPDGSLEFGTINVLDNVKKVLTLRNKGMYKIGYCFILKGTGPRTQDLASHFTVEPWSGVLIASQPGVNIEMVFQPKREMLLKSRPILYCQVTDASSGEGGQIVATIPVRVSAKAVYSKYSIEPASPIDFGAMIKGSRKTQTVLLENKGMLSFKFCIQQAPKDASASAKQLESPALTTKLKSSSTQDHLNLGMFMVSPCSGSVAPWGQQKITVDCLAGQEGKFEEQLYIDITGRDTTDNPLGIPFTLIAESCLPAFIDDVMLTFEEYPICSSTNLCHKLQSVRGTGLFVRDENKFIFTRVLVGEQAEANFNIYSASGMPCDVVLSIKPLPGKEKSPINNIFKLCPVKMSIPGSSKAVATVTFTPPDQQSYECTFKASLVIPKSSVKIKPQTMTFTISGKGHEPQVSIVCPSARSKRGNAVLRFKRLRVGDSEMLPLVVSNNSVLPVKFMLHLEDEHGAFFLKGRPSTLEYFHTEDVEEDWIGNESKSPKKPFFLLRCGQSTEFDAIFKPNVAQRLEGKIRVLVGNVYKSLIELVGEGHEDEFTLDGLEEDKQERNADSSLKKDIIDAVRVNYMQFGDCPVGKPCRRTFTITNHSHRHAMRFQWDADAVFWFSPKMGHLHPGCAKDITVTLKSDVPAVFRRHLVKCKVSKIKFGLPRRKVQDWDDQMTIVTWKDTTKKDPEATWPMKEKIVETAPEPAYTVVDESSQEAEVYLSAFVAYTQFKLSTIVIQLKDTLTNQTSVATFSMHNTGKIALEYTWMEAKDSEPVTKPYSPILMRKFLSPATLKYRKRLLDHFWWEQDHPFETYPSELQQRQQLAKQQLLAKRQQLAKQQHHSQQQQQQQDSAKNQQPSEKQQQQSEQQQQPSEQQQSSEEEQLDSKQKKHPKKQRRSKEQNLSQQQQPSEQQHSSEEHLDSKQKKHSKKQRHSKEQHPSEQQQPSEQQHEQPKQQKEHPEQQEEQPKQQEEQSEKQQPKHWDHAEKLHHSMQKHLSLKRVSSSMEIFPDFIHDLPLFSLNPYHGIIAPGQKQIFQVLFSPKCAGTFETTMVCRIPNLKPDLRKARVIVKGRAREQKSFDKPKRSALRQTEKGQGPKKQVRWKPTLE